MKRSPKLPAFSGRCRANCLTNAAKLAACEALEKEALAPATRRAKASRSADSIPLLLLALLAAYALLSGCQAARPAARDVRHEHAAPAGHGRHDWYEADTITD